LIERKKSMYEVIPLSKLVEHPLNANRLSRMFAKKLQHNISRTGRYETLTVMPHPSVNGTFYVLNGHARLAAIRSLHMDSAKCDVWNIDEHQAKLFLAALNRLRGTDVPELRMKLLLTLLEQHDIQSLSKHIPETISLLNKLLLLPKAIEHKVGEKAAQQSKVIIVEFYLGTPQHTLLSAALNQIAADYGLEDSSQALIRMAEFYMQRRIAKPA